MANFQNNALTDSGRGLLSHVQVGAVFTPTKIVVGSGSIPAGKTAQTMTSVVTPVKDLVINKKQRTNDGKVIIGGMYTNQDITANWYYRELAVYAKAVYPDGTEVAEVLYCYGNAGETADLMPAYGSGQPVERQIDIVTYIGNNAEVNLTLDSGIAVTVEMLNKAISEISPAAIGAARSGFGYGEMLTQISATSANQSVQEFCQAFDEILDKMDTFPMTKQVGVSAPWAYGSGYYLATIYKYSAKYSVVVAYSSPIYASAYGWRIVREDTTWGDVEWINAPMRVNFEYRTTERIDGKAVYKKNVNGVIQYRLDGETEWKPYVKAVGGAESNHSHSPADIGALAELVPVVEDCNAHMTSEGNKVLLGRYYSATANSPKSEGLTELSGGLVITFAQSAAYSMQICLLAGNGGMCFRSNNNGTISKWAFFATADVVDAIQKTANAAQTTANNAQIVANSAFNGLAEKAPAYTYGTEDLEAGVSPLETGKLYFVYE